MPINFFFKIDVYSAIIATNTETKTIDTVLSNFMTVFSAGPALNTVIKLLNTIAIVFVPVFFAVIIL